MTHRAHREARAMRPPPPLITYENGCLECPRCAGLRQRLVTSEHSIRRECLACGATWSKPRRPRP